jgi:hypothetical protein
MVEGPSFALIKKWCYGWRAQFDKHTVYPVYQAFDLKPTALD